MKEQYTQHDLRLLFIGYCNGRDNKVIADLLNCDRSQLSRMLSGERPVTEKIAKDLFNLRKVSFYEEDR